MESPDGAGPGFEGGAAVGGPRRSCPVCGRRAARELHHQRFLQPEGQHLLSEYVVCVCGHCGAGYADGIPSQEEFDAYYETQSKYENAERDGAASPYDAARFERVAEILSSLVSERSLRILEVGASTGGMLDSLRKRGYGYLLGIDPSLACEVAATRRGIEVKKKSPAQLAAEGARFGLVILLAVLEHVRNLDGFVSSLRAILSPGGALYVQVPDAGAFQDWPDAPFQQFSVEHINFLAGASLCNLMRAQGFKERARRRYHVEGGAGYVMPVVDGLYQLDGPGARAVEMVRDEETEPALRAYIERSRKADVHLTSVLSELAESGREVLVWGVGTHTQRLLAEGRMEGISIAAFVDSNYHMQGSSLGGRPILAPADLSGRGQPILISSRCFQAEIREQIREVLKVQNEIITLYEID